jgi:hypothetical protein
LAAAVQIHAGRDRHKQCPKGLSKEKSKKKYQNYTENFHAGSSLPNVKDEPRPQLARAVQQHGS